MNEHTRGTAFPKHFDGKRFFNPDAPQVPGFRDVIRWKLTSRPEPSPSFIPDVEPSQPPPRVNGNALRVTLVNHSTVLLQQRGSNILRSEERRVGKECVSCSATATLKGISTRLVSNGSGNYVFVNLTQWT